MSLEKFFLRPEVPKNGENKKENNLKADALNRGFKKAVIGTLLVSKLGLPVQASNENNKFNKSAELNRTEDNRGFESDVTINESKGEIKFQATNYFDTDSDHILPEAEKTICINFQKLLNEINSDNYSKILEGGVIVQCGADLRLSHNFKNNEELAVARARSLILVLQEYIQKAQFPNLNIKQINTIKNNKIEFIIDIPMSEKVENPQSGVIYPEDLGYNKEDLSKMDEKELEEVYSMCRIVSVSLVTNINKEPSSTYYANNNDFINPLKNKEIPGISKGKEISPLEINWNAEMITMVVDNSPSFLKSYLAILNEMKKDENLKGKKINMAFFSDKLGDMNTYDDIEDIINIVSKEKYKGSSVEHLLQSSLEAAEKMPDDKKTKILKTFTDEKLQGISLKMMTNFETLLLKKNIKSSFYYVNSERYLVEISLIEIKSIIEKQLLNDMSGVLKNYINNKQSQIRGLDRKQKKFEQEQLNKLKDALEEDNLSEVLENPLINEAYPYRDVKGFLFNKTITSISLDNIGKKVIFEGQDQDLRFASLGK